MLLLIVPNGENKMQIKNYSVHYGDRVLAENLQVDFSSQVINVISGANGSGKTTLLDFIAGIEIKGAKGQKIDVPKQQDIAYQLQRSHFFPTLTVAQTIQMYQQLSGEAVENNEAIFQIIKREVLDKIWHVKMGQLSGGERQIILTYGQCLLDRKLYVFDEPTSGVDVTNAKIIMKLINSLVQKRQKLVILTTHNLEQLIDLPVRIIHIDSLSEQSN